MLNFTESETDAGIRDLRGFEGTPQYKHIRWSQYNPLVHLCGIVTPGVKFIENFSTQFLDRFALDFMKCPDYIFQEEFLMITVACAYKYSLSIFVC